MAGAVNIVVAWCRCVAVWRGGWRRRCCAGISTGPRSSENSRVISSQFPDSAWGLLQNFESIIVTSKRIARRRRNGAARRPLGNDGWVILPPSVLKHIVRCTSADNRRRPRLVPALIRIAEITHVRFIGNPHASRLYGNVGQIYHSGLTVQFSYLRAAGNGIPGAARWKTGSCQPSRGWLVRPPWTPAKLQTKHQRSGALPASTNIKNTRLPFRGKFQQTPATDPLPTKNNPLCSLWNQLSQWVKNRATNKNSKQMNKVTFITSTEHKTPT